MIQSKIPAAINVSWWFGERPLEGEEEFNTQLAESYTVSVVRGRRGPLGGGLYQLVVEFLSQLTLSEIAKVILEGAAFDLIKSGTKAFFIKPFLEAYKRFESRQNDERLGIDRIRFVFQDAAVTVERLPNSDLLSELKNIFRALAENFGPITLGSKGQLFEIFVPVFVDLSDQRVCKFRTLLSVDESLDVRRISSVDYLKFWGLQYYSEGSPSCVYDVERKSVIEERFCTETQYWAKM
jgi:hypothetical protein